MHDVGRGDFSIKPRVRPALPGICSPAWKAPEGACLRPERAGPDAAGAGVRATPPACTVCCKQRLHALAVRMPTGSPRWPGLLFLLAQDAHNLLRPEAIESFYILWKTTGDPRYKQWAWQVRPMLTPCLRCASDCAAACVAACRPVVGLGVCCGGHARCCPPARLPSYASLHVPATPCVPTAAPCCVAHHLPYSAGVPRARKVGAGARRRPPRSLRRLPGGRRPGGGPAAGRRGRHGAVQQLQQQRRVQQPGFGDGRAPAPA